MIMKWGPHEIAKIVGVHSTFGALAVIRTCDQSLLRVVANKCGQNGMALAPDPVAAHHRDTSFVKALQGLGMFDVNVKL